MSPGARYRNPDVRPGFALSLPADPPEPRRADHSVPPCTAMKKTLLSLLVPFAIVACGGGDADTESMPEAMPSASATQEAGTVTIVTPANGALINGSEVSVTLSSTVSIQPAGTMDEGTGHHHLFLNADVSPAGEPVPTVPGSIIHMGDASAAYVFRDVPSGEYRLIAVVADGLHIPLQPWVVDTVTFTVQNQ